MTHISDTLAPAGREDPGSVGSIAEPGAVSRPLVSSGRAGRLPPTSVVPAPRRHNPHEIARIHFARRGQKRSWAVCTCGQRVTVVGTYPASSHETLYARFASHVAGRDVRYYRRPPMG